MYFPVVNYYGAPTLEKRHGDTCWLHRQGMRALEMIGGLQGATDYKVGGQAPTSVEPV